jgi:hypothetical protein
VTLEETAPTLGMGTEQRGQLGAALLFAREQAMHALARHVVDREIGAAFATLAERVEADDRRGVEGAIDAARAAIRRYRQSADGDIEGATGPDLEALTLMLDNAEALAKAAATAVSVPGATTAPARGPAAAVPPTAPATPPPITPPTPPATPITSSES